MFILYGMSVITKDIAKEHLEMWLEAEKAVMSGQSYSISAGGMSRTVTKVNLKEIHDSIRYWNKTLKRLASGSSRLRIHYPRV